MTVKTRGATVPDMRQLRSGSLDALAGELRAADYDGLQMRALEPRSIVNLRGPADDAAFAEAIAGALRIGLPLEPNRWSGDSDRSAIWLGPDEWLIVGADGDAASIEEAIHRSRPDDPWLSAVDVSHNYTALLLSGSNVRELLSKGCPLDLHPRAFGPGDCAQTILAKTRVLLRVLDDGDSIEVWVRNSFARYTANWLLDAATEFRHQQVR